MRTLLLHKVLPVLLVTTIAVRSFAPALPMLGTAAPSLDHLQLLQAPPTAIADWNALRGKIVVLEFWATWCAPCVAELPHLNKLVNSLDSARFQFISMDDEDVKIVQSFLTKRQIAGWVGTDPSGAVFKRFGVIERPTTIIVDGRGKIAARTSPEDLNIADLRALAAGTHVKFKPLDQLVINRPPARNSKPLYEISLSRASRGTNSSMAARSGQQKIDFNGFSAEGLILAAYDVPKDRLIYSAPLPDGFFDLHAVWPNPGEDRSVIIKDAIAVGLNLQVQRKTVTKKAYVLKKAEAGEKSLTPTAMTAGSSMRAYENGKLQLMNQSMDGVAAGLEDTLEVPVINQTGIAGNYDAVLEFPKNDVAAVKAVLLAALGLELTEGERPITMLEVQSVQAPAEPLH